MRLSFRARGLAKDRWAPGASVLALAAKAVEAVAGRGESTEAAIPADLPPGERSAVRAVALGTLRWYLRLAPALEPLLSRPAELQPRVRALMVAGAHQLAYSRNSQGAVVDAAVDAARILDATRATKLVNAVLRRFAREQRSLLAEVDGTLEGRTAHPGWLIERMKAAWPLELAQILDANNAHPPMTLRVDLSRISRTDYTARLNDAGIETKEIQWLPFALTLTQPVPVDSLPGFAEGLVSVQDAGAQLAAPLLEASPGMHVLDACAAPGGKTLHLLELLGADADVLALEVEATRAARIRENLRRVKRSARVVEGDACQPATFWDGRAFERILVDAPCSSTGVIRRHPDIKLLRRPGDMGGFVARQLQILRTAAQLLADGGRMVYSTCSVLPQENEEVIGTLLACEPRLTAKGVPCPAPGGRLRSYGWQLLPGAEAGTDGFYYACLEKTTAGT
jgi:16S rRNA (cytosine967-C5)-methyltransferase